MGDWRIWALVASLIKDFVLVVGIVLVKFNDLKHLDKDVKTIQKNDKETREVLGKKIDTVLEKITDLEKAQTAMKAVCDERHKE